MVEWTNWRNLNLLSFLISLYNEYLEFLMTSISGLICIKFKWSRTLHMSWKCREVEVFRRIRKAINRARKLLPVAVNQDYLFFVVFLGNLIRIDFTLNWQVMLYGSTWCFRRNYGAWCIDDNIYSSFYCPNSVRLFPPLSSVDFAVCKFGSM